MDTTMISICSKFVLAVSLAFAFLTGCSSKEVQVQAKTPTATHDYHHAIADGKCDKNTGATQKEYEECLEKALYALQNPVDYHHALSEDGKSCVKEGNRSEDYDACLEHFVHEAEAKAAALLPKQPGQPTPPVGGLPGPFAGFGGGMRAGFMARCTDDFAGRSFQRRIDTHLLSEQGVGGFAPGQMFVTVRQGQFWPCTLPKHMWACVPAGEASFVLPETPIRCGGGTVPMYGIKVGVVTDYQFVRDVACGTPMERAEMGCSSAPALTVTLWRDRGPSILPEKIGTWIDNSGFPMPNSQGRTQSTLTPGMFMR